LKKCSAALAKVYGFEIEFVRNKTERRSEPLPNAF
jgi:hypothetical protein